VGLTVGVFEICGCCVLLTVNIFLIHTVQISAIFLLNFVIKWYGLLANLGPLNGLSVPSVRVSQLDIYNQIRVQMGESVGQQLQLS